MAECEIISVQEIKLFLLKYEIKFHISIKVLEMCMLYGMGRNKSSWRCFFPSQKNYISGNNCISFYTGGPSH